MVGYAVIVSAVIGMRELGPSTTQAMPCSVPVKVCGLSEPTAEFERRELCVTGYGSTEARKQERSKKEEARARRRTRQRTRKQGRKDS